MKSSVDEIVRTRAAAMLRSRIERGKETPAWMVAVAGSRPLAEVVLRPFADPEEKRRTLA